jgi:hypothetical protein
VSRPLQLSSLRRNLRRNKHFDQEQRPPEVQVALPFEESHSIMLDATVQFRPDEELAAKTQAWLKTVGLHFNPYSSDTFNAADDPNLGKYLVDHDAFAALWGDWVSTIFAPTGGGKSAFRARLAYAARIGENRRRIFPLVYTLPLHCRTLADHLEVLAEGAAYELLLEIAYRPSWFEALGLEIKTLVRQTLDRNAPGWTRFLPQLDRDGNVIPLAETFDRSASHLPNFPSADRVRNVCSALRPLPTAQYVPPVEERWSQLIRLLLDTLQFEAVYVLVDGADAYPETVHEPEPALQWLDPVLAQVNDWYASRVFLKLFLPGELQLVLEKRYANLLTSPAKFVKIVWTSDRLAEVVAARLRAASTGEFDSLDAICSPALRNLNHELAMLASPPVPREVVALAGRVILEHIRRSDARELLQPEDFEAAREWYHLDRSAARSP